MNDLSVQHGGNRFNIQENHFRKTFQRTPLVLSASEKFKNERIRLDEYNPTVLSLKNSGENVEEKMENEFFYSAIPFFSYKIEF